MSEHEKTELPAQPEGKDLDLLIDELRAQTLGELAHYYWQLEPDKGRDGFATEFFHPMSADASINGERFRAEFVTLAESGALVDLRFAAMTTACAYCVDVTRLLAQGQRELAWWSMSEARYWCGVTLASRGIDAARSVTIDATRTATARKGGNKRAEKLGIVKEEAFRLARQSRPKTTGWASRLHAAHDITDRVVAFSLGPGRHPLTTTGAADTIYDWLAQMPDAELLFPKVGPAKNKGSRGTKA